MRAEPLLKFASCRRGIAAIEFALILPLMALLFFGMLEASDLLTVKRKVANAANSLADLVSQDPTIEVAEIDDSIVGVRRLLEPADGAGFSVRVVSLVKGPNAGDPVTVHWSLDQDGDEPYAPGAVYDKLDEDTSVRAEASLLLVEMDYEYSSGFSGRIFTMPFDFSQSAKRWPRKSSRVQLCATSDPATCTS